MKILELSEENKTIQSELIDEEEAIDREKIDKESIENELKTDEKEEDEFFFSKEIDFIEKSPRKGKKEKNLVEIRAKFFTKIDENSNRLKLKSNVTLINPLPLKIEAKPKAKISPEFESNFKSWFRSDAAEEFLILR